MNTIQGEGSRIVELACRETRILVSITFHFVESRLQYLADVVRELYSYPVAGIAIVIHTNTDYTGQIAETLDDVAKGAYEIQQISNLEHPFDLAWGHKQAISERFLKPTSKYSHFIYLEDDERLTFASFLYFLEARAILRPYGLIPSFIRTEWSGSKCCLVNVDNLESNDLAHRSYVACERFNFVALDRPYCGMFILDRALAEEYVSTRSFGLRSSTEVACWDVRERAAMGLMFENRPNNFDARGVVPVDVQSKRILPMCTIAHLPNTYADDPRHVTAKLPLAALFTGDFAPDRKAKAGDGVERARGRFLWRRSPSGVFSG